MSAARVLAAVLARSRFVLLVGGVLGVIAGWPWLRNAFDKLTRPAPAGGGVSADTEYWCPMCPGVVSDWPTKCPVCHMALVRRLKGEMTPLPDGVVARVQLSPYRVQLAGIHTTPVEYRRLEHEVTVPGRLDTPPGGDGTLSKLTLTGELFEPDARLFTVGLSLPVTCGDAPGETFPGVVADVSPNGPGGRRVRVLVDNPRGTLRPGLYAAAKHAVPLAHLDSARRLAAARWRDQAAARLYAGPIPGFAVPGLFAAAVEHAAAAAGLSPAVPELAVIDTGARRVVFVESMPGTFDAVEVQLGRRCGDHYPVLGGLDAGRRVVTAGAVLLDAETRLNPSVAAAYFGAGPQPTAAAPPPAEPPAPGLLTPDEVKLAARQKLCPVTDEPLGSMGGPVRVVVNGRTVFICCKGCEKALRKSPDKYLAKLPK
jgi:Cu(I)/Ag(I) efflux system membrane fusion protein